MSENIADGKYTYLERKVDLVRTRNIREPYEKMPENDLLLGVKG
jgi:hypothetical protein